ncbi:OsmC family protein [Flavobacteriales bacterium]|nr:OsmC family protein [Flavobacteriales bacterium]MDC3337940.1 OsmC family protein [Flavobacteriales bacterium]
MKTIEISYENNLRSKATHLASGSTLVTDAPIDNHGKGETYSPTDLLCASLGTCITTIIAIEANRLAIDIQNMKGTVNKTMTTNPRRVASIEICLVLYGGFSENEQKQLYNAAVNCPVSLSLHPEVKHELKLTFSAI